MKFISIFLLASSLTSLIYAQSDNPKFDAQLAAKLGGDDYGMKMYVFAILKTGSAQITKKETVDSLFRGHMTNMIRLSKENKLTVAGPMQKNDRNYRGIFILNVQSLDEAKILLQTDPAIAHKLLDVELYNWYGSAALPLYLNEHEKIEKKKF